MRKRLLLFISLAFLSHVGLRAQYSYNQAGNFNGTSSYIAMPSSSDLNPAAAITIEAWVYPTGDSSISRMIYGKNYNTSTAFAIQINTRRLIFIPKGGAGTALLSRGPIPNNRWTHLAGTYDGTTTCIYIDGVLDTSTASITGPIGVNTDSVIIGADRPGTSPTYFFKGYIDEVRLWQVARTAAQIYRDRFTPLAFVLGSGEYTGLMATYRLNGNANDESGAFINNGYPRNLTYVDLSQRPVNYVDYNNTLLLDGTTGYCVAMVGPGATTAVTLEAWVRPDTVGAPATMNIVNKSGGTDRYNYALWRAPGGRLAFQINNPTIGSAILSPAGVVPPNRWSHVAGTYNSANGSVVLYVNGDSIGGGNYAGNPAIENISDSLFIGGIGASLFAANKFKGQIDEVRAWRNVVRSRSEIRDNMYRNIDFTTTPAPNPADIYVFGFDGRNFNNVRSGLPVSSDYLGFRGTARMTSAHLQINAEPTSPLLRDDPGGFGGPTYSVSRKTTRIIDNLAAGTTDSVYVSASGNATGVKMFLMLNHTYINDLVLRLTGPTGVSALLHFRTGAGNNDMMCIYSDNADSIAGSTTGFLPPFSPFLKPYNPLAAFVGAPRQGWWKLNVSDNAGADTGFVFGWGIQTTPLTGGVEIPALPWKFELAQNYPNPFNPTTTIRYSIPKETEVSLIVYNILGQQVATLVNASMRPGDYSALFDARRFASGTYFYRLTADNFVETKKMILLK